ncbi:MAG: hypothetical protein QMD36_04315 [Candidatus Aenigmarchaeota archaeon]|nr:hypothetical protein [Candidatus Aenigmarchaeota archaeon]
MVKILIETWIKKIDLIDRIKKLNSENILFYSMIFGVLLLSAGVYVMGSGLNRTLGKYMIIFGSGIFYVGVVIFTFSLK